MRACLSTVLTLWLASQAVAQEKKPVLVTIDGLKSKTPAGWVEEETTSQMRFKQFKLPAVGGDTEDAQLIIYFFGTGSGGSLESNLKRWKEQIVPADGKNIDDVAKIEHFKVKDVEVATFDAAGTYKLNPMPNNPKAKVIPKSNYRFLGAFFASKNGPYFMRLVGPAKTVSHYKKGYEEWLKAFE